MTDLLNTAVALSEKNAAQAEKEVLAELERELPSDTALSQRFDLAFEIGDWLFDHGRAEAGARVYRKALTRLEALADRDPFALARRFEQFARRLNEAGAVDDAAEMLRRAIALSESVVGLDARAVVWRREELSRLEAALGHREDADRQRDIALETARDFGLRELSYTTTIISDPKFEPRMPELAGKTVAERSRLVHEAMAHVETHDQNYLMVPVHFATHRAENPAATDENYDPYNRFGAESRGQLAYGRAIVTVPARRVAGFYKEPSTGWFGGSIDKAASFTVHTIEVLRGQNAQDVFISDLKEAIEPSKHKELLVFLHGYRTSFSSGLMRAAQLKVDMKIEGAVVLYSLPSRGSLWGYGHDRVCAQRSLAHEQLRDLLIRLSEQSGATRIHLVGHSLGCEMLFRTLNEISKIQDASHKHRFDEIIFAAPDVDRQDFLDQARRIAQLGRRTTVYASRRDIPLLMIGTIVDLDRAGLDAAALAGIAGIDSIDTTAGAHWFWSMFDGWGHWDFADGCLDDVRAIAWLSLAPPGRRSQIVKQQTAAGNVYWAVKAQDGAIAKAFRHALEYARQLGLEMALVTARNSVEAERSMIPPGERLAEFERLRDQLAFFLEVQTPK